MLNSRCHLKFLNIFYMVKCSVYNQNSLDYPTVANNSKIAIFFFLITLDICWRSAHCCHLRIQYDWATDILKVVGYHPKEEEEKKRALESVAWATRCLASKSLQLITRWPGLMIKAPGSAFLSWV